MGGYSISDALSHRDQPEPKRPKRRRGRRRIVTVFALGAVLAGGGAAARVLLDRQEVFGSPETAELPLLPDDPGPTLAFLSGPEGVLIENVLAATEPLLEQPGLDTCRAVTDALDRLGAPAAVFTAAAGFPDSATAEMAIYHVDATTRFLGRCFEDGVAPDTDELRFTATILARRLEELR